MVRDLNGTETGTVVEKKKLVLTDAEIGIGTAILRTFQECVRHPLDIFSRAGFDTGISRFFLYALLVRFVGALAALELRWLIADIPLTLPILTVAVLDVVLELILLPLLFHPGLWLFGVRNISFRSTFNILALSKTAAVLIAIPLIGWQLYVVVMLAWTIAGLARGHGVPVWKSLLAVLLPVLLVTGTLLVVMLTMAPR